MDDRINASVILGVFGTLLTIARRINNKDHEAGQAVAGWTIFVIGLVWLSKFLQTATNNMLK